MPVRPHSYGLYREQPVGIYRTRCVILVVQVERGVDGLGDQVVGDHTAQAGYVLNHPPKPDSVRDALKLHH